MPRVSEMKDPVIMRDGGGLYWAADKCGYVADPRQAGIYERAEVIGYTGRSYADKRITLHPVPEEHTQRLKDDLLDARARVAELEAQVEEARKALRLFTQVKTKYSKGMWAEMLARESKECRHGLSRICTECECEYSLTDARATRIEQAEAALARLEGKS